MAPNTGNSVLQTESGYRILCVADIRGQVSLFNTLAKENNADCIIHTGDFGFYDEKSIDKISDKTLKHLTMFSPLIEKDTLPSDPAQLRSSLKATSLSELSYFLNGKMKLEVPVYAIYGICEDVAVLEKFRSSEYRIPNLYIVDESSSRAIDTGHGLKLRLLGLGGTIVMHKLFDNGAGRSTLAGGAGTMWTTLLQIGELVQTAARVHDPSETRILITHASPAREGLLSQIALSVNADFTISASLHFRYGSSYNEFSVNPTVDYFRGKLSAARAQFYDVWDTVKDEVIPIVKNDTTQKLFLESALAIIEAMPTSDSAPTGDKRDEMTVYGFKNIWSFNLADVNFGTLVLAITDGRVASEMKSRGFSFQYRNQKMNPNANAKQVNNTATPKQLTNGSAGKPLLASSTSASSGQSQSASQVTYANATESPNQSSHHAPPERQSRAAPSESTTSAPPPTSMSGLWIARGEPESGTVNDYFAEPSKSRIKEVVIKATNAGSKIAFVYFETREHALDALNQIDLDLAGKANIINDNLGGSGGGGSSSNGPRRGGGPPKGGRSDSESDRTGGGSGGSRRSFRGSGRGGRGRGGR